MFFKSLERTKTASALFVAFMVLMGIAAPHNIHIEIVLGIVITVWTSLVWLIAYGMYKYEKGRPHPNFIDLTNEFIEQGEIALIANIAIIALWCYIGLYTYAVVWTLQTVPYMYLQDIADWQRTFKRQHGWFEKHEKESEVQKA